MHYVNSVIPLMKGPMELRCGDDKRPGGPTVSVVAEMPLSPMPRVLIKIPHQRHLGMLDESPDHEKTVRMRLLGSSTDFEGFEVLKRKTDFMNQTTTVEPSQEPVTTRDAGRRMSKVQFSIINFPSQQKVSIDVCVVPDLWRIEITPKAELEKTLKVLKSNGGYGLTHDGVLQRSDGGMFSVGESEVLLRTLYFFLSFARGGRCGVGLAKGWDEACKEVWTQWGSYPTHPWVWLSSWLDHQRNNEASLAEAFAGFWRKFKNKLSPTENPILMALYWYMRANESGDDPYTAIILVQAALERLSCEVLSASEPSVKGGQREKISAACKISKALREAHIDAAVPAKCKELLALKKKDGPHLLAYIRNDLVHSRMDRYMSPEAYMQARELGLWYVELLLLRLIDYKGQYANRITYMYKDRKEPELVPWAC